MSEMLLEKPHAEQTPRSVAASVIVEGRYLPPPEDRDGKQWIRTSVLVQAAPQALYALWRDVERAPFWHEQLVSVTETSPNVYHWVKKAGDSTIEWDAETLADEPGRRIVWRTMGGDVEGAGEVVFEASAGGRGTVVTLLQEFRMGTLASTWATLVGRNPKQEQTENLRHFKALAETGEIPRTDPQPHGDRGVIGKSKRSIYGENVPTPQGTSEV